MLDTYKMRDHDMPEEMRFLLESYPRDDWETHPGFKEKTRHWLSAHRMFRRVSAQVRLDTEAVLNKDIALGDYVGRLSYFGGNLVGNLHGHHGWEDHRLDLLEQDHADLDVVLDDMTRQANRVIKLSTLDESQALEEAHAVLPAAEAIEAFLKRHLSDEEELAVPIILHHRLRG